jgi:hypothetical protein
MRRFNQTERRQLNSPRPPSGRKAAMFDIVIDSRSSRDGRLHRENRTP